MELLGREFGHIRVTDVIGQGGMGDVYAGHDQKLDRRVALKVLRADQRLDAEARERLLLEARALSRLDHPNICRIYDYIETGGVDLLVLEYIDGRTLDAVTHAAASLPRAERLRIAVSVAEALVKAHRAGIIHRDLKPENVMLTRAGEVKVLDFGLARWLQVVRSSDQHRIAAAGDTRRTQTVAVPSYASSSPTMTGMTMGTPLYMSPEQARGEVLTTASDMFSFGLLLQSLFTGREPHPETMGTREIILRVSRGETDPVQGAPSDVTALINSLKQLAPADRPTAVDALERLRWLSDKPNRIARRAVAAAVALLLLFGGWRYMVDLRRERAIAVAARGDAEDLIEFMVGDLRKKLEPVGRLDVLDDVGERALAYIGSHDPQTMPTDTIVRNAKVLTQLGEVRVGQGKLSQALPLFNQSLSLAEIATKRDAESQPAQFALATAHFWIGDVYRQQGRLDEALASYTNYMNAAEALAKKDPKNEEWQLERAYGHSSVASIYELQGEFARALDQLQFTREVKAARVAAKPVDEDRQADLGRTLNRIGFVLERLGDLRGARTHYEQELATYSTLVARNPKNAKWKARLVVCHNFVARALEMTGDVDAALSQRKSELALSQELAARDPDNAQWQRNLGIAQIKYGDVLRAAGDARSGLASIRAGQETLQRLLAKKENVPSWTRDMATAHAIASRAWLANGDAARAVGEADAAVQLVETLAGSDAAMPRYIADSYVALGDARAAAGETRGAAEAWQRAAGVLSTVDAQHRSPEMDDLLARALVGLGRRGDAAPLIEQLNRIGYRAPDFVRATAERAAKKEGAKA